MSQVEGTFGIAVIHRQAPGEIVVARRGSPLIIGVSDDGHFVASDVSAMVRYTNKVVHLEDNELASVTARTVFPYPRPRPRPVQGAPRRWNGGLRMPS